MKYSAKVDNSQEAATWQHVGVGTPEPKTRLSPFVWGHCERHSITIQEVTSILAMLINLKGQNHTTPTECAL